MSLQEATGIRWFGVLLVGCFAVGSLTHGNVLAGLILLLGCALIAPQSGNWAGKKFSLLHSGGRQVAAGSVVVVMGLHWHVDYA